ncbi:MAG: MBL fold metallo-hydrolase [Thermoanaerobaculales bacterium]|nr:MBL fold metallo-hydrolase [Thermoanaerobaculales bacterium]
MPMNLTIHRGTHEIGGTCVEVVHGSSRIILDLGMPLINPGGGEGEEFNFRLHKDTAGVDLVAQGILPDVAGLYEWDTSANRVDGVLISHAHLDHYGFTRFLHPEVACYLGEATKKLIDLTCLFTPAEVSISRPVYIASGTQFSCGEFSVTPYLMDHAGFDAYAFMIEAGGKRLLYSGDFREHGRKRKAFEYFLRAAPRPVDALLLEGTMMGRKAEEVPTEEDIEESMVETLRETDGPVLLFASSQNIDRMVSAFRAARRSRRMMVIDLYTAHVLKSIGEYARIPQPGPDFSEIRVFYPYRLCRMLDYTDRKHLLYEFTKYKITKKEIGELADKALMLVRPSMLGDLERISNLDRGALVYSMWNGYLKKADVQRLVDFSRSRGMEFLTLHTSGHATVETLQRVVDTFKPTKLVPIHTFHPHRYHQFGAPVVEVEDGQSFSV